ncbi:MULTISPECIES: hypothetical protein [Streptomyces]|uniref:Uncharacterized protein n=2 Tax=Streptomyces TaxID=1883 RepID=A0ABU2RT42_9ACTN|nr:MULTISPECIES: hypothetical protein [unclassified Streptomyces]MBK3590865.1 hypothetical protein [Streptomyces sp. MBT51]MDT0432007.1 hypothetical protein [Streptomyces sp. DSM 41770]
MRKAFSRILVGALMAGGVVVGGASGASAATPCGGFNLYYNSNQKGACITVQGQPTNFDTYRSDGSPATFNGCAVAATTCPGLGQNVKNNAASAANWWTGATGRVYFNSNHKGAYDTFGPQVVGQLVNTYNNNASFTWWQS